MPAGSNRNVIIGVVVAIVLVIVCACCGVIFFISYSVPYSYESNFESSSVTEQDTDVFDDSTPTVRTTNEINTNNSSKLNLTYDEVMDGFEDKYKMEPDVPAEGYESLDRYFGVDKSTNSVLQIIGDKSNLTMASLYIEFTSADNSASSVELITAFLGNTLGSKSLDGMLWTGEEMQTIVTSPDGFSQKVFGDKKVSLLYDEETQSISIIVEGADS